MPEQSPAYAIEEVTGPDSLHLAGMDHWLKQVFPEYAPSQFPTLLTNLRHGNGQHEIQLFVGLIQNEVVGLLQVFYRPWHNALMADIDLLGVLEPYRRLGLAAALVRHTILAARQMATQYELPVLGIVSLVDPQYVPVIRLHEKLGGQVRIDYVYPSGDIIVWYPLLDTSSAIETSMLAQQLEEFGRVLKRGFGIAG